MDKTIKNRKFIAEAICALLAISGFVLQTFFDTGWLAILLMAFGTFGFVLIYGFAITKKHIKSKNSIGRRIRICYAVGFLIVTTSVIFTWIEKDYSLAIWGVYFGLFGMAIYLSSLEKAEDFILEEEERKRKFEADDDLEEEVSFEE